MGVLSLTASAQYKVVVTTTDGEKKEFETANVQSIRFEEAPEYVELTDFLFGEYTTKGDNGIYEFILETGLPDSGGNPAAVGDVQISMVLVAERSEDYLNAILPNGYYHAGAGSNKGEFNVQNSGVMIRLEEGENGVMTTPIIDGTVDVRSDGEVYDIKFELTTLEGGYIALAYKGELSFSPGLSEYESFTEDQNITFVGAQERYFANWFYPFCDDATLELYTGTFNSAGSQTEGYWLSLSVNMPKAADPKNPGQYLADGVYTVDPRENVAYSTQLPYTIQLGKTVDFWGVIYPTGSYLTKIDKSGRRQQGFITDGTVTVSNGGGKIEIDLVTADGIKIQGSYEGRIVVDNRNDSETAPAIEGTIDKDIEFDFIPGTIGMSYPLGDYIKSGIYQFSVMIMDSNEHGDFIMMELSSDQEVLPDGTYTFNNEIAPFDGIKGYLDYGGNPMFSWYGNLDDVDENGVQNIVAPIMGGTVTISTTEENTRKLVFDLLDEDGHKMTGTYEGIFYNLPLETGAPAKKAPLKNGSKIKAQAPARVSAALPMRIGK